MRTRGVAGQWQWVVVEGAISATSGEMWGSKGTTDPRGNYYRSTN